MSKIVRPARSNGEVPRTGNGETGSRRPGEDPCLLTLRSAAILGASVLIAVIAGGLTYLGTRGVIAGLAWAALGGGAAFAGAIRLLNSIIA